jgi:hypothetical protein
MNNCCEPILWHSVDSLRRFEPHGYGSPSARGPKCQHETRGGERATRPISADKLSLTRTLGKAIGPFGLDKLPSALPTQPSSQLFRAAGLLVGIQLRRPTRRVTFSHCPRHSRTLAT